jgi:hypothetical protein
VTPTDFAAEEIALWEQALREQQFVEEVVTAARATRQMARVIELAPEVRALRTRADLLLAEAIKVKCTFRDHRWPDSFRRASTVGDLQKK